MASRADYVTQTQKQQEFFSDFVDSFAMTPFGNQVGRVTNVQAINQSVKNLILTQMGERLFQPYVGSYVYNTLFEPMTSADLNLEFLIRNAIKNNEPRIGEVVNVNVVQDQNNITVTIEYVPINNTEMQTFNFILKRVR